ncbi:unnamed protein product [Chondrus crispus]|uniref:Uncharacterized protein n=1 Tax=Chondrus crispus TaxID=2769 RepID=R7Q5D9_CHOCR|nr:unnamed protein product [Chondrus crispus]CDF32675.1 unnamed protein product [Chondrus crispus]|eukprot:XP_005712446.1 unnamed protein product [Chondrus crispus]
MSSSIDDLSTPELLSSPWCSGSFLLEGGAKLPIAFSMRRHKSVLVDVRITISLLSLLHFFSAASIREAGRENRSPWS